MRQRGSAWSGLIVFVVCATITPASEAQQGYYGRTGSKPPSTSASPPTGRSRDSARLASRRDPLDGAAVSPRIADDDDPLRPYASQGRPQASSLESQTRTQPPARPQPAPPVRRNYFPDMRVGQGPNRNVPTPRHHCVPGRGQLLGMRH